MEGHKVAQQLAASPNGPHGGCLAHYVETKAETE